MAVMMDAAEDAKPTNDEQTVDKLFFLALRSTTFKLLRRLDSMANCLQITSDADVY